MGYATAERHATCDALLEVGADAPTLCEGWTAHDLAAHLWVREHDPLAAPGMLGGPLAGFTDDRMDAVKRRWPFAELVEKVRSGPAGLFALPGMNDAGNTVEYFVHCEDVRRPNDLPRRRVDPAFADELWRRVRTLGKLLMRRGPDSVILERAGTDQSVRVRPGSAIVTIVGEPGELLLFAYGRREHADVELIGEPAALRRVTGAAG